MTTVCFAEAALLVSVLVLASGYDYKTYFYTTKVDHFGYANNDTYEMRYLIGDQHWNGTVGGPIFFYTGNEGGIEDFAQNAGLMWDWAPEFGALLVFAEHRYYGKSQPYGPRSYESPNYLGYLTAEQALADYADLLQYLKATIPGTAQSPVVSFGGSYGGMLAAWFRMKYPHVTVAALAASAPVLQFQGLTPCDVYNKIVTKSFRRASANCVSAIRNSWTVMQEMASTDAGAEKLGAVFRLCNVLTPNNYTVFRDWVYETYGNLAMMNYPYPSNLLNPVPAYPVEASCKFLDNEYYDNESLVQGIFRAVSVFTNYTGSLSCNDASGNTDKLGADAGWDFQSCTEMVMPMCSDGVQDMFFTLPWNLSSFTQRCQRKYDVTPEVNKIAITYGGRDIKAASNIIFSNGDMDPWSGGGFLSSVSDSLIALLVEGGAHHYDLRAAHANDTDSVRFVRAMEKKYIRLWLDQYKDETQSR